MAHIQEIAEDAVSALQRPDVVGKQNLSKQTSMLGHNPAKYIQTRLQYKNPHHRVLQVRSFIVPYGMGQQAEVYGNTDVTEATINQHPSQTLKA